MFDFVFINSIDATYSTSIGRYVNDSPKKYANCTMKMVLLDEIPRLILKATKDIPPNMELRYDYGDRRSLHWRKKVPILILLI